MYRKVVYQHREIVYVLLETARSSVLQAMQGVFKLDAGCVARRARQVYSCDAKEWKANDEAILSSRKKGEELSEVEKKLEERYLNAVCRVCESGSEGEVLTQLAGVDVVSVKYCDQCRWIVNTLKTNW